MKKSIFTVFTTFAVVFTALAIGRATAAKTNVTAFYGRLADGQKIELLFVESTGKLAVAIRDKEGKYLSGYIFKGVSTETGDFKFADAYRHFGDATLSTSLSIKRLADSTLSAALDGGADTNILLKKDSVKLKELSELSDPPFGECTFWCYEHYDWYMCFYCCSISSDC
ncbi:MAG: hypothetical protein JFAIHJKO_01813 [Pyrinomonadaceae bacterium]|nr:hypothetical protein [Pyrinomonadaceae bacterium]